MEQLRNSAMTNEKQEEYKKWFRDAQERKVVKWEEPEHFYARLFGCVAGIVAAFTFTSLANLGFGLLAGVIAYVIVRSTIEDIEDDG